MIARAMRGRGGGGQVHAGGDFFCAGVHAKLFWIAIYCAKPRPNPGSQSGYRSCMGMGRQVPWIMREYYLVTAIAIGLLTQLRTRERGSSSFFAMSRLKFVSTARASFLRMPSTEKEKGYNFPLLVAVLTVIIFLFLLPTSQEGGSCL